MPRIQAATVAEHREHVLSRIAQTAEALAREGGVSAVTASAVAAGAGIARNSLYRYVSSVQDLHAMVVQRYLPSWAAAVGDAVAAEDNPSDQVLAWARANLDEAAATGHAWLVALGAGLGETSNDEVAKAHGDLGRLLARAWQQLDPQRAPLLTEMTRRLVDAGMARIDAGDDPMMVRETVLGAVRHLLVTTVDNPGSGGPSA